MDSSGRVLRGAAAATRACPRSGDARAFVAANPGLFHASGFAHDPYSFFLAPQVSMAYPSFVPLADLSRLERGLDAIFTAYGVPSRLPLWLTEYGYETDPPNPFRGVSPATQALYLDEAQYMAFRDPRVRGLSQFLLFDALPDAAYRPGTPRYWSTFQTGLMYADGTLKPSFGSYRLPLFLPDPLLGRARSVLVWAMLRPAAPGTRQLVSVQWRSVSGGYRTIARVAVHNAAEVLIDRITVPGPGVLRIAWTAPDGAVEYSRGALVGPAAP